jgi:DNA-binding LacI/PurR family transcriptional regulator
MTATQPGSGRHKVRFVATLMPSPQELLGDETYYGPMLQGLSDGLLDKGLLMRPIQCLHDYQQDAFLHSPPGLYAGAVFVGNIYADKAFIQEVVRRMPGPKVMLDHHFGDIPMHSVREDAVAGMRTLAGHLLSLGHRRIAYLDMPDAEANPWKRDGVNLALREASLPELARGWVAGCRRKFSDVAEALDWFTSLTPPPTAIMCCDDVRALLVLQAAAERGLRVPHDISVTGYGDMAVRTGRSRALTSVAMDVKLMGRRAAELAAGPGDAKPVPVLVPPELVARGTTARPPT